MTSTLRVSQKNYNTIVYSNIASAKIPVPCGEGTLTAGPSRKKRTYIIKTFRVY